jgi:hypothetical protein
MDPRGLLEQSTYQRKGNVHSLIKCRFGNAFFLRCKSDRRPRAAKSGKEFPMGVYGLPENFFLAGLFL